MDNLYVVSITRAKDGYVACYHTTTEATAEYDILYIAKMLTFSGPVENLQQIHVINFVAFIPDIDAIVFIQTAPKFTAMW